MTPPIFQKNNMGFLSLVLVTKDDDDCIIEESWLQWRVCMLMLIIEFEDNALMRYECYTRIIPTRIRFFSAHRSMMSACLRDNSSCSHRKKIQTVDWCWSVAFTAAIRHHCLSSSTSAQQQNPNQHYQIDTDLSSLTSHHIDVTVSMQLRSTLSWWRIMILSFRPIYIVQQTTSSFAVLTQQAHESLMLIRNAFNFYFCYQRHWFWKQQQ